MTEKKIQLPDWVLEKAANRIRFMAHAQRLRIIEFLDLNGPATVTEIVKAVDGIPVIVSQSLKKMKQDGFVDGERSGKFVVYRMTMNYPWKLLQCMRRSYALKKGLPVPAEDEKSTLKLPAGFLEMVAGKIAMVGHSLRLRMLDMMDREGPVCVKVLMEKLGTDQITASQNLKKLKNSGLVRDERKGRFVYYGIAADLPKTLLACTRNQYAGLSDKSKF